MLPPGMTQSLAESIDFRVVPPLSLSLSLFSVCFVAVINRDQKSGRAGTVHRRSLPVRGVGAAVWGFA